jgi:hypothetical protein
VFLELKQFSMKNALAFYNAGVVNSEVIGLALGVQDKVSSQFYWRQYIYVLGIHAQNKQFLVTTVKYAHF